MFGSKAHSLFSPSCCHIPHSAICELFLNTHTHLVSVACYAAMSLGKYPPSLYFLLSVWTTSVLLLSSMLQRISLYTNFRGFPGGTSGKEPSCQCRVDLRDVGLIPGSGRSPGGGHGNLLQYSGLENLMDRGAWWAEVYAVTQSRARLKQLSMHTHRTNFEHNTWYLMNMLNTIQAQWSLAGSHMQFLQVLCQRVSLFSSIILHIYHFITSPSLLRSLSP